MPEASKVFNIAELSPAELEARRRQIVASCAGNWEALSVEDLRELSAITSALRRRTAGPPKAAKAPSKAKSKKATAEQVLLDI